MRAMVMGRDAGGKPTGVTPLPWSTEDWRRGSALRFGVAGESALEPADIEPVYIPYRSGIDAGLRDHQPTRVNLFA